MIGGPAPQWPTVVMDQPLQRTSVAESSDGESLPAINLKDPSLYINRELSWLEFNQRVLAQAQDTPTRCSSA